MLRSCRRGRPLSTDGTSPALAGYDVLVARRASSAILASSFALAACATAADAFVPDTSPLVAAAR
jgi:hypothetical protein